MYNKDEDVVLIRELSNHPLKIISSWARNQINLIVVEVNLSEGCIVTDGNMKIDVEFDCLKHADKIRKPVM